MSALGEWLTPEPLPIAPVGITLISTCYHEAGHFLIYHINHWPVTCIEIDPDGTSGSVTPAPGGDKDIRQYCVACLAGPCSESRYLGIEDFYEVATAGGMHDLNMARSALARLPDPPSLYALAGEANAALTKHWKAVERVAFALAEQRVLTGAELAHIVRRW